MAERSRFTSDQWRTLQFAPFWLFSTLVGSYNRFDPRELRAFARCLEAAAATGGRLSGEVFASVLAERDELDRAYAADPRTIASGLVAVTSVLDRVSPEQADDFNSVLFTEIGQRFARARGPWGEEIGEDDDKTLTLAAALLSFEPVPG